MTVQRLDLGARSDICLILTLILLLMLPQMLPQMSRLFRDGVLHPSVSTPTMATVKEP